VVLVVDGGSVSGVLEPVPAQEMPPSCTHMSGSPVKCFKGSAPHHVHVLQWGPHARCKEHAGAMKLPSI